MCEREREGGGRKRRNHVGGVWAYGVGQDGEL